MTTVHEFDRARLWRYRASLVRIKDADSLSLLVDTGFSGRHEATIRLVGINAPERGTPAGEAATAWLEELMMQWSGFRGPWPLRVVSLQRETVVSEVRSFERFVGSVYLIDDADQLQDVGEMLVAAGHAMRIDGGTR